MKKYYFTFGQAHIHYHKGKRYDKDCVVLIEAEDSNEARDKMFKTFGPKWSMQYNNEPDMSHYPKGIVKL